MSPARRLPGYSERFERREARGAPFTGYVAPSDGLSNDPAVRSIETAAWPRDQLSLVAALPALSTLSAEASSTFRREAGLW